LTNRIIRRKVIFNYVWIYARPTDTETRRRIRVLKLVQHPELEKGISIWDFYGMEKTQLWEIKGGNVW
jgi:hypothetical protein